eukprot:CAMPEP_0177608428 /NCGR_PEP_ID=MMETSP0419_2-20121207/18468_1 /TAXON_ID=582737 /ORGANISM="Tetraselmis sp., Strain GSL018" /LENGTH=174 /DNA_ID=CAMNT_0019103121 /DNA_START=161 /DNA_END=683 /DNA_ORIENTATION=+
MKSLQVSTSCCSSLDKSRKRPQRGRALPLERVRGAARHIGDAERTRPSSASEGSSSRADGPDLPKMQLRPSMAPRGSKPTASADELPPATGAAAGLWTGQRRRATGSSRERSGPSALRIPKPLSSGGLFVSGNVPELNGGRQLAQGSLSPPPAPNSEAPLAYGTGGGEQRGGRL